MPKPDFSRPNTGGPKKREPMTAADVQYNKRLERSVQEEWVEACAGSGKLSSWEQDFIDSIGDQLDRGGTLSERQVEVLEKIYQKV